MKKIIKYLEETAEHVTAGDDEDFNADGCFGGTVDDAYFIGSYDGRIYMARGLLRLIKKGVFDE